MIFSVTLQGFNPLVASIVLSLTHNLRFPGSNSSQGPLKKLVSQIRPVGVMILDFLGTLWSKQYGLDVICFNIDFFFKYNMADCD